MTSEYGTETTCPAKLSWLYKTDQNTTCPVKPDQKDPALSEFIDLAKIENDAKLPNEGATNQVECNNADALRPENPIQSTNRVQWTNTPGINARPVLTTYTVELIVANGGYLKYTGSSHAFGAREIDLVFVRCFSCDDSRTTIDHDSSYKSSLYLTIKTDQHESAFMFNDSEVNPTELYLFSARIIWDAVDLIKKGMMPGLDFSDEEN